MKERWIMCPVCQRKTHTKMRKETILIKFPLFCPKCKNESIISVEDFKLIKEPDAKTQSQ